MSADLSLQTPALAWSSAEGNRDLPGLDWVEARPDAEEPPYSLRTDAAGDLRFRGGALALPPSVTAAVAEAMDAGEPTAWEGLSLLFARAEWTVASRGLLWTPATAAPGLLASLVESAGVDAGLHQGDPDRLRRLAALLPAWRPGRGTASAAAELLRAAGEGWQAQGLLDQEADAGEEEITAPVPAAGEVFVIHCESYWKRRVGEAGPSLRVQGGLLRASSDVDLRREDLPVQLDPDGPAPRDLYRLLPAWTVARPLRLGPQESSS